MADWVRKFLYRIFCVMALMVSVYLIVDFLISGTFDYRVFIMFVLIDVYKRQAGGRPKALVEILFKIHCKWSFIRTRVDEQ